MTETTVEIPVDVYVEGEWLQADTPEDAVYAALTRAREYVEAHPILGYNPRIVFEVAGKVVRVTTRRDLMRA